MVKNMIKVLDKIFLVLETVVSESPNPVTPLWIASKLGMNRPTCSRILKELTDAGYLMHVSRQTGYTAGPRSCTFSKIVKYKPAFLDKAIPHAVNCARTLAQSVLICERRGAERYVLHHSNFSPLNLRINQLSYRDLFDTATGLVLLSAASRQEQEKIFNEYRAAGDSMFPEFTNFAAVASELERCRNERFYARDKKRTLQWIAAVPIAKNGETVAALGVSALAADVTMTDQTRMLDEIRKTAVLISNELSTIETTG